MKRFLTLVALATLACAAILSSCKKDDPIPPVISITTQPAAPATLIEGDIPADIKLTVVASVTENAKLTYQWYRSVSGGGLGRADDNFDDVLLDGATTASYTIPTDLPEGMHFYFCEVAAEGAKPVRTDLVTVTVTEPAPADTTAPTVVSVSPADEATDVAVNGSLSITFSEAMDTAAGELNLCEISSIYPETLTNPRWSNGNKTYTVDYSGLAYEGSYYYELYAFRDEAGNVYADYDDYWFKTVVADPNATYSIALNAPETGVFDFGSEEVGYAAPGWKDIHIENTGTGKVFYISATASADYSLLSTSGEIPAGAVLDLSIRPTTGLAAGQHNTTLTFTATGPNGEAVEGSPITVDLTFTVTAADDTVYDKGVIIGGIKWATRNVGAPGTFVAAPESVGMYYQWGRNVGWSGSGALINSDGGTDWDSSQYAENVWLPENDPCPTGWRMPTNDEFESLANAGSEWTTVNEVNGQKIGTGDDTIFLPATGYRDYANGALTVVGSNGYYWSNTPSSTALGYNLYFAAGSVGPGYSYSRAHGFAARCVSE